MEQKAKHLFQLTLLIAALVGSSLLVACGGKDTAPVAAVIEETPGGLELLEREFGECNEDEEADFNTPQYVRPRSSIVNDYPHQFSSLSELYPMRGTWRQSKTEIMDIVDRYLWSPELHRGVRLLHYFEMALLINVAPRDDSYPQNSSAQRMQVLVRDDGPDDLNQWKRIHSWPISSGTPCGKKIATFTGVYKFNPSRIYQEYFSELFEGADMYETMFLYSQYLNGRSTGVAIHGTYKTTHLGRQDSGGCIRVHRDNSQCLYETIEGRRSERCLDGGLLNYRGRVPSFLPRYGEADPEYLRNGKLEVDGIKVLVVIFNDSEDLL